MTSSSTQRSHTSSPAVLGALVLLAFRAATPASGSKKAAPTGPAGAADKEILTGVEQALELHFPDDAKTITNTVAEVAAALRLVRADKGPPGLSAAKYEAERKNLLDQLGLNSTKGASIWPPTSQTAVQRFGSWNDALKAAGLKTSSIGRARGQLRFDAAAYEKAIAAFVADCETRGLGATYKAYGEYAAEHKGEVPSAAAVRKFYGSWNEALAALRPPG